MSLVSKLRGTGESGFGYGSTAEEVTADLDLSGRRYLITGCNSGLGKETMRVLALRGADIIGVARSREKAEAAANQVGANVTAIACDLSEPRSAANAAAQIAALDRPIFGVIANAGIMALPERNVKHGIELQFLTNHIGHFILMTGLLEVIEDGGRVVVLSSEAHRRAPRSGIEFENLDAARGYRAWRAYGQSKLANLLFARHLATRLIDRDIAVNALHPGVIHTKLSRHMNPIVEAAFAVASPLVFKNVAEGAATQCYVAAHPAVASTTGQYFSDCNIKRSTRAGRDLDLAARLWRRSEELTAELLSTSAGFSPTQGSRYPLES